METLKSAQFYGIQIYFLCAVIKKIVFSAILFSWFMGSHILFSQNTELVVQIGHTGRVNSVVFSPDGKYILSGSDDRTAKLWEVAGGNLIRTFTGHTSCINYVAFSPDGKYIATASDDSKVKLWDALSGVLIREFRNSLCTKMRSVAFSPNGKYLLAAGDEMTILWDASTGSEVRTFGYRFNTHYCAEFDSDGKSIITGSDGGNETIIWNAETGEKLKIFKGPTPRIKSVKFSPDGKYIAAGDIDGKAIVWDLTTGTIIRTYDSKLQYICSVSFSPDGKYFLTSGRKGNILWDTSTGVLIHKFSGNSLEENCSSFSPDGKYMVAAGDTTAFFLWEVSTGKKIRKFDGNSGVVYAVAYSPDGKMMLSGTIEKTAKIWDISTGKLKHILTGHSPSVNFRRITGINTVSYSHSGKYILTGSYDGTIKLWEASTGKELKSFSDRVIEHFGVDFAIFSPDEKYILAGKSNPVLWEISLGLKIREFEGLSKPVHSASYSTDGKTIVAGCSEMAIIWSVAKGKKIRIFDRLKDFTSTVLFSPDGKYVFTSFPPILWDVATGKEVQAFMPAQRVSSASFSPDGKFLLTSGRLGSDTLLGDSEIDNMVELWDIFTGKSIRSFKGHSGEVVSVSFNPNGKQALTGSRDGTCKIWDVLSGQLLCSFVSMGETDWAAITPDGFYMTSKTAIKGVHFVQGMKVYTFDNFDLIFNRPDIVLQKIGLADPSLIRSYKLAYLKRLKKMGFDEGQISLDMHLPEIEFTNKSFPMENKTRNISFQVKAFDSKYQLDRINLYVNNVPVYDLKGMSLRDQNLTHVVKDLSMDLSNGTNKIQVSVLNNKGAESLRQTFEILYQGEQTLTNLYVVVIGVSEYQDNEMNLGYASKDANDLADLLEKQTGLYGKVNTIRLTDQTAIRENIMNVKKFLMQSTVDDEVIFFVAGHGLLDSELNWYFATYDVDFGNPSKRGILYDDLEGLLDGIPARKKLLLMDACNSGEVDKEDNVLASENTSNEGTVKCRGFKVKLLNKSGLGLQNSFELMQDLFANLQKGSGTMVISSASGAEYALESNEWSNGVFTFAVLEGIRTGKADTNKDKQIIVSELRDYVFSRVKYLTNGKQNPTSRQENLEFDFRVW